MSKVKELIPLSPKPVKDRLTMTLQITHSHHGDQPAGVQSAANMFLETKEETYTRRNVIGSEWVKPKLGEFEPDQVGYIVVDILEGLGLQVIPTAHEAADIAKRVIE